ncbi:hypothetical protein [Glaciimonas sp. PCH181]|uniref:hypothetical protein n=1 Tax=Glaciimonas sp. PCH181 TaxID=2133943 RepID=UPI000D3357FA|nr:hypothetical protein [Glaciimonas sp. PCH181]PUA19565.1 hypothetical protein C7W93_06885 [Glaciimonas sp. PCH181]
MKRFVIATLAVLVLLISGCALPVQPLTPAQIVAQVNTQVCQVIPAILVGVQTPGLAIDPALQAKIPIVQKGIADVCTAGVTIDPANLQTLATSALPVILEIVKAVPGPQQDTAVATITAAQILLPILIAQIQAMPTATVVTVAK